MFCFLRLKSVFVREDNQVPKPYPVNLVKIASAIIHQQAELPSVASLAIAVSLGL